MRMAGRLPSSRAGLTLIEILIVVALVALLAAVQPGAVPHVRGLGGYRPYHDGAGCYAIGQTTM